MGNQKEESQKTQEDFKEKFFNFMVACINAGDDKNTIKRKLSDAGLSAEDANTLVEASYDGLIQAARDQRFTYQSLLQSIAGGIIAAIVGGVIWGLIVIWTDYEVGYMAIGIGVLCGYGVLLFSRGKRGVPYQIIAVLSSFLGMLIGKYYFFYHILKEMLNEEYGTEIANSVSVLSGEVIDFFVENIDLVVDGYDILWIFLALAAAVGIPRSFGIKGARLKE